MEPSPAPAPLSFSQERLWFLHRLAPDSAFYNLQIDLPLHGAIDEAVLRRTLTEIVRRHEILRTSFDDVDGEPMQFVQARPDLPLITVDLRELPLESRDEAAGRRAAEDARRPFDLACGPLVRATLVRLADDVRVLYLTLHHIVTDGWSMDLLTQEIAVLYDALAQDRPSPLPELPIQYADFAIWQRQTLTDEQLAGQLAYWRTQLAGHGVLELPTDHPRPAFPSYRGGFQSTATPPAVADALRRLCRNEGATLFMGLLAAFQCLLMRYTGQDDIIVGTPIANRTRAEVQPLIGFFVNTLVMRSRVQGGDSLRGFLRQVRETALAAYAHQDLPFERLVEELQPQRDPSRNPLFQVMFVLQNSIGQRSGAVPAPSYQASPAGHGGVSYGNSKFDLTLYLAEDQGGISAIVEYSTDLFADDTITRFISHWQTLLQGIAASPDMPMARLPLLPPAERSLLLTGWTRTGTAYPRDQTIVSLFEQQVRATPQAIAVNEQAGQLSYRELALRSHRLARELLARGLQPGERVGLSLPRGIDMVVSLLAVLQAGGAYLPLDPGYPAPRLDRMIADAAPRLLLSRSDCAGNLQAHELLLLDRLDPFGQFERLESPAAAPPDIALPTVTPDSPAYVLYTSGSTGQPKGVCVSHRNVVRLVRDSNYCRFGPDETMLMFAPLQFDASTFEIWGALLNGARLEIAPPGQLSVEDLAACIERSGVTLLWLTASLFHQVVDAQLGALWRVRQLLAGGDTLAPGHCQRVLDELPGCTLINGYGPTETTTFAACHRMMPGERLEGRVPIGRPVANARLYVLTAEDQLAPIGVPGELYIGGDGVASGYLNDPELTAARFVPNPFEPANSPDRLYRSGDQVRWRADGVLEFLGRRDHQIKLRGFRIELAEIEAVMRTHPLVRDACVVLHQEGDDRRLYGYAALEAGQGAQEVRRYLQQQLPDYMVPAVVIGLDKLPITPSGKVDRQALPRPTGDDWHGHAPFAAPQSELERLVAAVWGELLQLERVGLHDNFFDLGGHSLLLAQVHGRLQSLLGRPLAMIDLFRFPTVESLAAHLRQSEQPQPAASDGGLDAVDARARRQREARARRLPRRETLRGDEP
ncbi:MAG: amino acid adenylation domain-containing protein [Burkholderiaceae bacterium]